jgi:hypothetical protein
MPCRSPTIGGKKTLPHSWWRTLFWCATLQDPRIHMKIAGPDSQNVSIDERCCHIGNLPNASDSFY